MAEYWLKRNANMLAEGPYAAKDLKAMAAAGQIAPDALLSGDRVQWTIAAQVKGLFPPAPPAAVPVPRTPARPLPPAMMAPPPPFHEGASSTEEAAGTGEFEPIEEPDPYDVQGEQPPALPMNFSQMPGLAPAPAMLSYAGRMAPAGPVGLPGQPRSVIWYLVLSSIFVAFFLAVEATRIARGNSPARPVLLDPDAARSFDPLMTSFGCFVVIAGLTMLIYGFVWIGTVHGEIEDFTIGRYSISPAKAVGFCFIPFFNLYWVPYMMYSMTAEIDRHLEPGRVSPARVLVFQILAFVPGCCLAAFGTLFFALAMMEIQKGLNLLWEQSPQPRRYRAI